MISKVVIPIAGHGSRMFPGSKSIPKAMFPILDPESGRQTPILQWIIQYALDSMVKFYLKGRQVHGPLCDYYHMFRVCVILSETQRKIVGSHFLCHEPDRMAPFMKTEEGVQEAHKLKKMAGQITFVVQRSQAGYGDAILCAREFVDNDPFLTMIGDHVYTTDHIQGWSVVEQMLHAYETYCQKKSSDLTAISPFQNLTSITTCGHSDLPFNGVLKISNAETDRVWELTDSSASSDGVVVIETTIEKPTPQEALEHNLSLSEEQMNRLHLRGSSHDQAYACYFGIEILSPSIFRVILAQREQTVEQKQQELTLRDPMRDLMHDTVNEGMLGLIIQGERHDTGMPIPYAQSMHRMFQEFCKEQQNQSTE